MSKLARPRSQTLSFSATQFFPADAFTDKEILLGYAYQRVAYELAHRLFRTELADAAGGWPKSTS